LFLSEKEDLLILGDSDPSLIHNFSSSSITWADAYYLRQDKIDYFDWSLDVRSLVIDDKTTKKRTQYTFSHDKGYLSI